MHNDNVSRSINSSLHIVLSKHRSIIYDGIIFIFYVAVH